MVMIKIRNLTKIYDNKLVIDNIDLDVADGEKLAVMGVSGCGKSTLLKLIMGIEKPEKGSIVINGQDITKLEGKELNELRKKINMVFQYSALFDSMTVGQNVGFGLYHLKHLEEKDRNKVVAEILQEVGMPGIENKMPAELSGGMQKRIGIARAIAPSPEIVLYDEPTTGLDPVRSTIIEDLINKMNAKFKVTSLIITHQISTIYRTADRIAMMYDNKLYDVGSPEEAQKSKIKKVRDFLLGNTEYLTSEEELSYG